jgi:hypothetical protein
MSRSARPRAEAAAVVRGRPLLVWVVYVLGVLAAAVLVASGLFAAGGYFGSDDTVVNISPVALVVWGGLVALAAATWLWRRREGRR